MITSVEFENFRCLRKATLRLGPLTALVGPNAAGKSSVLTALNTSQVNGPGVLPSWDHLLRRENVWRHAYDTTLEVMLKRNGSKAGVRFSLSHPPTNEPFRRQVYGEIHRSQFLHCDLRQIRLPSQASFQHSINETGSNLASVLLSLPRDQQEKLSQEYCKLVPVYGDIYALPTESHNYFQVTFRDRWLKQVEFSSSEVSDGSLLLLVYVTLQFQRHSPDLLLIDEPERGLHPYLIEQLVQLLRAMSEGKVGSAPLQVVLATHSPVLLSYLKPEEVRFLDRNQEDGSVTIREAPTDSANWEQAYAAYEHDLGSLWLSGGMGAVPSIG